MPDNRPLTDQEACERLQAAADALGETPAASVRADTALTAAKLIVRTMRLGLEKAMQSEPPPDPSIPE